MFPLCVEFDLPALIHYTNDIETSNCARTMGDDNDDSLALPNAKDRPCQSFIAFCIKIRIWLIENDQDGLAEKCASKRYSLRLTSGKRYSLFANDRLVATG